ncbi:MAG: hypothetical protein J6D10_02100 [Clostridia bacterium]|nr:hypothetical protein [Clostridia bacterium]
MYDTITTTLSPYEHACSQCIDDLYHTAYLVLVDADASEKLVTEICVTGVHKYDHLEDEAEIRFRLAFDLYRRVKRRLWFCTPDTDALPEQLRVLTKQERLVVAMRFSSGLSAADSGRILGVTPDEYRRRVNDILQKSMTTAELV